MDACTTCWIDCKKELRRFLKIDGVLTVDIDGRAMFVQLAYQDLGLEVPEHDPYIHTGIKRKVFKKLMVLILNTTKDYSDNFEQGRKAVISAYQGDEDNPRDLDHKTLRDYILEIESHHYQIRDLFYKSNWGKLQRREAEIMLCIMEDGMRDGIVVLPVHDGCLCRREHRDKVLSYFTKQGIVAAENDKHLNTPEISDMQDIAEELDEKKTC